MEKKAIQFEVVGYSFTRKAGKGPVYKIHLKSGDGHALTLVSDTRAIYQGFPMGELVSVTISRAQRTMDEIPEVDS